MVRRAAGASGRAVVARTDPETLTAFVTASPPAGAMVYTDAGGGYNRLPAANRGPATVHHTPGQRAWARDDDGDGVREVHAHTRAGLWAALRPFRRPFRGVSQHSGRPYVAVFPWAYHRQEAIPDTLRILRGLSSDAS